MKTRLLLGSALVLTIVLVFVGDYLLSTKVLGCAVIFLLAVGGWLELAAMTGIEVRVGKGLPFVLLGVLGTSYFLTMEWWSDLGVVTDPILFTVGVAGLLFGAFAIAVFVPDHQQGFAWLTATVLGVLLCGFLMSHLVRIYQHDRGLFLGAFFILGAKGNDIAAFFTGRAIGRHTFLKVSPKKTLEGCAAAVVFSVGWFIGGKCLWPDNFLEWPWLILFAIIFSVTTQLGDLAASLLKRSFGVKDSSSLLPEFGGVLDMTDSILFSGVLFWILIEQGVVS